MIENVPGVIETDDPSAALPSSANMFVDRGASFTSRVNVPSDSIGTSGLDQPPSERRTCTATGRRDTSASARRPTTKGVRSAETAGAYTQTGTSPVRAGADRWAGR